MSGRALAFADANVIRLARENFVTVAADDWYQRRRQDDEGEFFRKVADQGPRKGEGGSTRQGIYIFTPAGKLLAFRNNQDPSAMKNLLDQGLAKWKALPAQDRAEIQIANPAKVDATFHRVPPKGGLVVNVYTRILDRTDQGDFCPGSCKVPGGEKSARDHLWLTEAEWKSLIPENAKAGDSLEVPQAISVRLARFHLVDNTRGEPPHWTKDQIRNNHMKILVEEKSSKGITLRLEGKIMLATKPDLAKAERGFDVHVLGYIHYDSPKKMIDRFDLVAVGDHWGEGPFTRRARPGKMPLGVAFELARGDSPADQVPPQGARFLQGYLQAER